jgi:hypothetical protein
MNNCESVIIAANYLAAVVGFLLMQSKYRGYTLLERLSLAVLIGALALNASIHVLDGRNATSCAEAILSIAILFRFLTAALWRFLKCGKCPVTIICLIGVICLISPACSSVDRDYQAGYDLTSGRAEALVSLTPGTGRRTFSAAVYREIDWTAGPKFFPDK